MTKPVLIDREEAAKVARALLPELKQERTSALCKAVTHKAILSRAEESIKQLLDALPPYTTAPAPQTCVRCGHSDGVDVNGQCKSQTCGMGCISDNHPCDCACEFPATATAAEPPLTDAEVDAFLREHENDPVDEARSDRIEWLFRKKLGAEWAKRGREYIENYEAMVQGGGGIGRDTEKLYSSTVELIREMVRAIETLALKPTTPSISAP